MSHQEKQSLYRLCMKRGSGWAAERAALPCQPSVSINIREIFQKLCRRDWCQSYYLSVHSFEWHCTNSLIHSPFVDTLARSQMEASEWKRLRGLCCDPASESNTSLLILGEKFYLSFLFRDGGQRSGPGCRTGLGDSRQSCSRDVFGIQKGFFSLIAVCRKMSSQLEEVEREVMKHQ